MYNDPWKYKRRATRRKAVFWTIVFHLALLSLFWWSGDTEITDVLPDFIREWISESPEPGQA